jgi:outer membrane receptor protein involved in Fe transport
MSLLLVISPTAALADDPISLKEVTVEASRVDALLPARTEVGRDEIIDSHKDELGGVLDLTPGVNVRDGGRGESRLDVRGFDQRAVLFTLNGVPVYEPWNGIINLNLFPLEMLGSIIVDRGPSSALFGPNGMGGTVKLTTFQPRGPVSASASTIWRDSDTWDARASGALSRDGAVGMIGGRYFTTPGFPLPGDFNSLPASRRRWEDGGLRLNSDGEQKNLFADLGYEYAGDGRAHVAFLGSTSSFGIPPSTTAFLGPFLRNDREDLWHVQGGLEQRLTPRVGAAAAVFYTAYDTKESQFENAAFAQKTVTRQATSEDVGGIGRLTFDLADVDSLAVATQFRYDDADVFDDKNGPHVRPHFVTGSVAAENVYQLSERVALVTGTSLDLQGGGDQTTRSELNPQGGVSVDCGAYGTARAGISRKIRFPTLRELYDPLQGNPGLKPETAIVYEVGHRVQVPRGYADINLFRSDVSNLIDNVGGDQSQFVNSQSATLQGVEIALGGTPVGWMQLDVNYTYLDTQASNPARSGNSESDVQHRPANRFNGVLRVFLPLDFVLRLEGLYTSDQLDRFGSNVTVNAYTLFNAQLTKRLGSHLQLFGGVDNILDNEHQDKLGSPGPGQWGFAGLRMTYD